MSICVRAFMSVCVFVRAPICAVFNMLSVYRYDY